MRVRDWQDVVRDVVDSGVDPEGWRAVAGDRSHGVGEDLYIGHPSAGVYQIKTYAKNPFQVRGVGSQVARRLDDEIGSYLPRESAGGRFAVQSPPRTRTPPRRRPATSRRSSRPTPTRRRRRATSSTT